MKQLARPSPNADTRALPVSMLVLHYTGMHSCEAALARMCDEEAKVSAHYCIDEDGTLYALVEEQDRAWHAGLSSWRGIRDVNSASVGIELVNPGHALGYRRFPDAQMHTLIALCQEILSRHPGIEPRNVVGHSDIAPTRKQDPGEYFDWQRLAHHGIGLWPKTSESDTCETHDRQNILHTVCTHSDAHTDTSALWPMQRVQRMLATYGYALPQHGTPEEHTQAAITAFARHFAPQDLCGRWNITCQTRLEALLNMLHSPS